MYMVFWVCSIAVVATIVVAILTRRNVRCVRATLSAEKIATQTASCTLLNVCLLVTWVAVLQGCVDAAKGASLGELFSVSVFYVALAALLFNKLRRYQEADPV